MSPGRGKVVDAGGESAKAQPPERWPRPLTKSPNSPSRLDHLRGLFFSFLLECEYFYFSEWEVVF